MSSSSYLSSLTRGMSDMLKSVVGETSTGPSRSLMSRRGSTPHKDDDDIKNGKDLKKRSVTARYDSMSGPARERNEELNGRTSTSGAGSSVYQAIGATFEDDEKKRERVTWCGFGELEDDLSGDKLASAKVLMLGYEDGFQIWNCENNIENYDSKSSTGRVANIGGDGPVRCDDLDDNSIAWRGQVREIVSRRDGAAVIKVCCLPIPSSSKRTAGTMFESDTYDCSIQDVFRGSRPAVAVLCEGPKKSFSENDSSDSLESSADNIDFAQSHSGKSNVLRIYSLKSHAYVHSIHFKGRAGDVQASRRLILVTLTGRIEAFSAGELTKVFTVMAYESILGPTYTVAALGPRWLAYSAADIPQNVDTVAEGNALHQRLTKPISIKDGSKIKSRASVDMDMVAAQAANVAEYAAAGGKEVMNRMRSLSESGYRAFSGYFFSDSGALGTSLSSRSHSYTSESRDGGSTYDTGCGVVLIRDVVSGDQVAHFRAHDSPLAKISFSSSGTLLATASITGNNINIFKILPGCAPNYQHIYKLHRGLTNATIRDISFSNDDKWIAASTGRGTAHVFAILEEGGPVSKKSHCIADTEAVPIGLNKDSESSSMQSLRCTGTSSIVTHTTAIKYSSLARLKCLDPWTDAAVQVSSAACVATGITTTASGASAVAFIPDFSRNAPVIDDAFVFSPSGSLTRYTLLPSVDLKSTNNEDTLVLNGQAADRWDVRRRMGWPERQEDVESSGLVSPMAQKIDHNGLPWSAYAELTVHRPLEKPLWVSSQFHFHVMQKQPNDKSTTAPSMTAMDIGNSEMHRTASEESVDVFPDFGIEFGRVGAPAVEDIPSRRVEVRRVSARGLIPFCETNDLNHHKSAKASPTTLQKDSNICDSKSNGGMESIGVTQTDFFSGDIDTGAKEGEAESQGTDKTNDTVSLSSIVDVRAQDGATKEDNTEDIISVFPPEKACDESDDLLLSPEAEEAWGLAWDKDFDDEGNNVVSWKTEAVAASNEVTNSNLIHNDETGFSTINDVGNVVLKSGGRKTGTSKGKNAILQKQQPVNSTDLKKCNANMGTTAKNSTVTKKVSQSALPPLLDNHNQIKSSKVKNLSKTIRSKAAVSKTSSIYSLLDDDFEI